MHWLERMRMLAIDQQPEWDDRQLDSAAGAWSQWWFTSPPKDAASLCILAPDQQFALEVYQSQFGWPRDSTEWNALPLRTEQREVLQLVYHHPARRASIHRPIEPQAVFGWRCSGCPGPPWQGSFLRNGRSLSLRSSSASWTIIEPWSIRSPSDFALRFWANPRVVAVAIQPRFLRLADRNSAAQASRLQNRVHLFLRQVDRVLVGMDSSGSVYGELGWRSSSWSSAVMLGSRGWIGASTTWYGPGGVLVHVQRESAFANLVASSSGFKILDDGRPAASATPWRALRGNRATAALPLWAGRLTLQQTTTGPSASWADRTRSVLWQPGQLALGLRSNAEWNGTPNRPATAISIRTNLYIGRAQGASVQLRCTSGLHLAELGWAALTSSNAVLPRALGPMSLWRPGWTAEASWTYRVMQRQMSVRIRRSPSGWSGGIRVQLPLQNW